ncbi:hypothetical protein CFP56_013086 [Quercus suber]|uniref:Uncharacterized protein n=1 Tax=Quercus suber TaxID=58331 RepID=A0AAW0M4M1_QUESU
MDTKNKKARDSQENKVAKEVNEPTGLDHGGKGQNTDQRNDKKNIMNRMGDNTELLLKDGLYAHLFKIQTDALA